MQINTGALGVFSVVHQMSGRMKEATSYSKARKQRNRAELNCTSHVGSWNPTRYKIFWYVDWLNELICKYLGNLLLQSLAKFWTT